MQAILLQYLIPLVKKVRLIILIHIYYKLIYILLISLVLTRVHSCYLVLTCVTYIQSIFEEINYNDALRDLKISWIAKLVTTPTPSTPTPPPSLYTTNTPPPLPRSDDWLPIYKDLISEYSEHIPLRVAKLHVIDSNKVG